MIWYVSLPLSQDIAKIEALWLAVYAIVASKGNFLAFDDPNDD